MPDQEFFRGGTNLKPSHSEVKLDTATGLLRTTHGVSVWDRPDGLERFGGAFKVTNLPSELRVIQRGRNPHHYEIVPTYPMPFAEYEDALATIVLVSA